MDIDTTPVNVGDSFSSIRRKLNSNFAAIENIISTNILFGVYKGNGQASREINLGASPVAVEIYTSDGKQYGDDNIEVAYCGGLALRGYPCGSCLEVTDNGFKVFQNVKGYRGNQVNTDNRTYYYKAYMNGTIKD